MAATAKPAQAGGYTSDEMMTVAAARALATAATLDEIPPPGPAELAALRGLRAASDAEGATR
jgi:hypothetical protein